MSGTTQQPAKSALDKLIGTVNLAIVVAVVGGCIYFFGPTVSQKWKELNEEQKKQQEIAEDLKELQRELALGPRDLFDLKMDGWGIVGRAVVLRNKTPDVLTDVNITVTLIKSDHTRTEVQQVHQRWLPGEAKRFEFSASGTRLSAFDVGVSGHCKIPVDGKRTGKATITAYWTGSR